MAEKGHGVWKKIVLGGICCSSSITIVGGQLQSLLKPMVQSLVGMLLLERQVFHHAQGRRGSQATVVVVAIVIKGLMQRLPNFAHALQGLQKGPAVRLMGSRSVVGSSIIVGNKVLEIVLVQQRRIVLGQVKGLQKGVHSVQTVPRRVALHKGVVKSMR